MAGMQHGAVHTTESAEAGGAPGVASVEAHPTSRTAFSGGPGPQQLERKSVAETVGAENVAKASTMVVEPSAPGEPPHLHSPATAAVEGPPGAHREGHGHGGGVKEKLKEVWHDVKTITPGTAEHKTEYGTGAALGGYRSQMGKR